jgi:hypothetical protein
MDGPDSEGDDAKPNAGIDGAGASVMSREKNSIDDLLVSRDEEVMLLMLCVRDIACRERLRARTSWAILLCDGAR